MTSKGPQGIMARQNHRDQKGPHEGYSDHLGSSHTRIHANIYIYICRAVTPLERTQNPEQSSQTTVARSVSVT